MRLCLGYQEDGWSILWSVPLITAVLKSKAGFSAQDFYPRLEVCLILVSHIIKNILCFTVFIGRLHFLNCSFTVVYKENTAWGVIVFMICISCMSQGRVSFKVSCMAVVISLWTLILNDSFNLHLNPSLGFHLVLFLVPKMSSLFFFMEDHYRLFS